MPRQPRLGPGLALLATLFASALCSSTPAEQAAERVYVPLVEVPVQVTLRGEPVRGLTADNFRILDRKRPQEIVGFRTVDLELLTHEDPAAWRAELPLASVRHFLVVFDLTFVDVSSLARARDSVLEWAAEELHPADLVAVATYSVYNGAELILNFTSDRTQVAKALRTLGLPALVEKTIDPLKLALGQERLDRFELSELDQQGEVTQSITFDEGVRQAPPLDAIYFGAYQRLDDERRRHDITALTRTFGELAELARHVRGAKHLIYLSEGFDSELIFASQNAQDIQMMNSQNETGAIWRIDSSKRFGNAPIQQSLVDMLDAFRRADCAIEAIDIRTLGSEGGNRVLAGSGNGLDIMAAETGGELHRNFGSIRGAMAEVLERTSVTYLLGFKPDRLKHDGEFHKLAVKLEGLPKRARVRHRPGYYAPDPGSSDSASERLIKDGERIVQGGNSGRLPASVFATAFPYAADAVHVPVLIEVGGRELVAGADGARLQAEVYGYAFDSAGSLVGFFNRAIDVDLTRARSLLESSGLKYFGELVLPPGDYSLRVLVRNVASDEYALRSAPLHVPSFGETPFVSGPQFPEPRGKWLLARRKRDAGDTSGPAFPFMLGAEPYLPAVRVEFAPGSEGSMLLMAHGLGAGDVRLRARVHDSGGAEVARFALQLLDRMPTAYPRADLLRTRFGPRKLPPGDYTLAVDVLRAEDDAIASLETPFSVAQVATE
ncbi:MAG: VWA domain-containing protein [bacterium]|nr:VWA domain-containing protein [bacterium]